MSAGNLQDAERHVLKLWPELIKGGVGYIGSTLTLLLSQARANGGLTSGQEALQCVYYTAAAATAGRCDRPIGELSIKSTYDLSPTGNKGRAFVEAASLIINVVEDLILPSSDCFQGIVQCLNKTKEGMHMLGVVCRAYVEAMVHIIPSPVGGQRCLRTLKRGVAPDGHNLRVVHEAIIHAARAADMPAQGLAIIRTPILKVSPATSGVNLLDYIAFYREGATLLTEQGLYEEATEFLYNVVVLNERECFPPDTIPENMAAEHLPLGAASMQANQMAMDARQLYVKACKQCKLLAIIAFCGGRGTNKSARGHPFIDFEVVGASGLNYRSGPSPYDTLLKIAASRDYSGWDSAVHVHAATFVEDATVDLVMLASERIQRYKILDYAAVYDEVPLRMLANAILQRVNKSGETPLQQQDDSIIVRMLRSMHEEGQLSCSFSQMPSAPDAQSNPQSNVKMCLPGIVRVSETDGLGTQSSSRQESLKSAGKAALDSMRRMEKLRAYISNSEGILDRWLAGQLDSVRAGARYQ